MYHGVSPSSDFPAAAPADMLCVGRNRQGHWVVRDPSGRWGGLFVSRAEAIKFALSENGHRSEALLMVPWELDLAIAPAANEPSAALTNAA